MKPRPETPTFLAALALAPFILAAGCSPQAKQSTAPAASAEPLASVSAAPPAAAGANGVPVDPDWVAEAPKLTAVLRAATPVCSTKEQFYKSPQFQHHSYSVHAPSLAQSDIERRLRETAKAIGLGLAPAVVQRDGPIFHHDGERIVVMMNHAGVTLVVNENPNPWEPVRALATKANLETWSLLAELGDSAAWRSVDFERTSGGGVVLEAEIALPAAKRSVVEAWARKHQIESVKGGWLRKIRQETPDIPSILIDLEGEKLYLMETRRTQMVGPACQDHPTRVEKAPVDAGPKQSEEELMRIMMGK